jgi:hypothetical protein
LLVLEFQDKLFSRCAIYALLTMHKEKERAALLIRIEQSHDLVGRSIPYVDHVFSQDLLVLSPPGAGAPIMMSMRLP